MYDTEHPSESTAGSTEFDAGLSVVLSSPARKRVLAALNRHTTLALPELARFVSEADGRGHAHASTSPEGDEDRITVMLHHRDLPKLAAYGIVEWENEPDRVRLTSKGAACAASLGL